MSSHGVATEYIQYVYVLSRRQPTHVSKNFAELKIKHSSRKVPVSASRPIRSARYRIDLRDGDWHRIGLYIR